jgi:hypothetical protein
MGAEGGGQACRAGPDDQDVDIGRHARVEHSGDYAEGSSNVISMAPPGQPSMSSSARSAVMSAVAVSTVAMRSSSNAKISGASTMQRPELMHEAAWTWTWHFM